MRLHLSDRIVDLEQARVRAPGGMLRLSPLEQRVLAYLASRVGDVIPRDDLGVHVWGAEPDIESRAIDATMRRLRGKLEADPTHPRHLVSVYGVGYRFEVGHPDAVESEPGPPAEPPLVAAPSATFGREAVLQKLISLLEEPGRVVTVTGTAGVGKTHVAVALASRVCRTDRADGVWIVDLAAVREPRELVSAIATALGADPGAGGGVTDDIDWLAARLTASHSALMVLDNAEGLDVATRDALGRLVAATPQMRFLITSRIPLALPDEHVFVLDPLSVEACLVLFLARARPDLAVGPATRPDIVELVTRLDGLPLAIELAASRTAILTPRQILERLDRRLSLLRDPHAPDGHRHASLRAALDVSWELVSAPDRLTLAHCSVFQGSFSVEDAEAILVGLLHTDTVALVDSLHRLASHSLIALDPAITQGAREHTSFRLLETIRDFAADRLAESGQADLVLGRHAAHFTARAARIVAAIREAADDDGIATIALWSGNLRAVLGRVAQVGPQHAALAANALAALHNAVGPPSVSRAMSDMAVALGLEAGDPALIAEAYLGRSITTYLFSRRADARSEAEIAAEFARRSGDTRLLARTLLWLGPAREIDDFERARAPLLEAHALFGAHDNQAAIARCESMLAVLLCGRDDYAQALSWNRHALARYAHCGQSRGHATALANHGMIMVELGLGEARPFLERAVAMFREVGYPAGEAAATRFLATHALVDGDCDQASVWLDACAILEERTGHDRNLAFTRMMQGLCSLSCGRIGEGIASLGQALLAATRHDERSLLCEIHAFRALAYWRLGDLKSGVQALREASRISVPSPHDRQLIAFVERTLAGASDGGTPSQTDAGWAMRLAQRLIATPMG